MCQAQIYKLSRRAELFKACQKSQHLDTHGKDFETTIKGTEAFLNSKYESKSFPIWEEQTYASLNFKENRTVWSSPPLAPCIEGHQTKQYGFKQSKWIFHHTVQVETSCLEIFQMTQVYMDSRAESTNRWKRSLLRVTKYILTTSS